MFSKKSKSFIKNILSPFSSGLKMTLKMNDFDIKILILLLILKDIQSIEAFQVSIKSTFLLKQYGTY